MGQVFYDLLIDGNWFYCVISSVLNPETNENLNSSVEIRQNLSTVAFSWGQGNKNHRTHLKIKTIWAILQVFWNKEAAFYINNALLFRCLQVTVRISSCSKKMPMNASQHSGYLSGYYWYLLSNHPAPFSSVPPKSEAETDSTLGFPPRSSTLTALYQTHGSTFNPPPTPLRPQKQTWNFLQFDAEASESRVGASKGER